MKNKRLFGEVFKALSKRALSEEEIRERIGGRFPDDECDEIISGLKNKRYIDDERLARDMAEKFAGKGKGYHYITRYLHLRKIRNEIIEDIQKNFDYQREFESARYLLDLKAKRKKPSALAALLKGRGFSSLTMERIAEIFERSAEEGRMTWKAKK